MTLRSINNTLLVFGTNALIHKPQSLLEYLIGKESKAGSEYVFAFHTHQYNITIFRTTQTEIETLKVKFITNRSAVSWN